MSSRKSASNSNTNTTRNTNARTPFCKVCFDAKKPQTVYETHWVKDREGNVTCPTLNSQECRYCFKAGHTVKHCPVLTAQNTEKEKQARRQEALQRREAQEAQKASQKAKASASNRGGFAALYDDSDDESKDEEESNTKANVKAKPVEEFPPLPTASAKVQTGERPSFARALAKPLPEVKKEVTNASSVPDGFAVLTRNTNGTTNAKMPSSMPYTAKPIYCGRWTELSDDEDSDEENDDYLNSNPVYQSKVNAAMTILVASVAADDLW